MLIKGIHYGLTLLYSYLLPVFSIEDIYGGFKFRINVGEEARVDCVFRETSLETRCEVSGNIDFYVLHSLLGLNKLFVFRQLCKLIGEEDCIAKYITMMHSYLHRRLIAYTIYLSRNTDYYMNTVRWVRELVQTGLINARSYQVVEFYENKQRIDRALKSPANPREEAIRLLGIDGFGVKSVKAYLLHAYGLTDHAPIDVYYSRFLGLRNRYSVSKKHCIAIQLDCINCTKSCPYKETTSRLRDLNGVVQSLLYIHGRLSRPRRSIIEEILVRDPSSYLDPLERVIEKTRYLYNGTNG